MTPLVEVRGVSKAFGGARALIDVDLRIEPGEVHGLLGQNGSGKSTLLKVLSGFHDPDAGTLTVRGEPVGAAARARRVPHARLRVRAPGPGADPGAVGDREPDRLAARRPRRG